MEHYLESTPEELLELADDYENLGNHLCFPDAAALAKARRYFEKAERICLELIEKHAMIRARYLLGLVYFELDRLAEMEGNIALSMEYCKKCVEINEALAQETDRLEDWHCLGGNYERYGDVALMNGDVALAEECFAKTLRNRLWLREQTDGLVSNLELAWAAERMASVVEDVENKRELLQITLAFYQFVCDDFPDDEEYQDVCDEIKKKLETL